MKKMSAKSPIHVESVGKETKIGHGLVFEKFEVKVDPIMRWILQVISYENHIEMNVMSNNFYGN